MSYIQTLENYCRLLLIINPASGMLQAKSNMFDIVSIFAKGGCIPTTLLTEKSGDAAEFVRKHAGVHDIIVCCGGDGTLNETITGMLQAGQHRPVGFIPCGTTNDMARTLGVPTGNVKKAAKAILSGDAVPQDIGSFCGKRYFNYVASFGAFTKVSYATPRWKKHLFGHMAYVMDGLLAINDIRPWKVRVSCAELEEEGEYAFGSVTNATSIAGLFKLDPKQVSLNDGKFEVMLVRHPKTPADMQEIIDTLLHQDYDRAAEEHKHPMVRFFKTDHITFTPAEEMPWTLDGEFGGTPEVVEIRNLHGAVDLLRKA
ncbi:MAG: diacylglycerol kinase family lipid kinase [Clostridia bacterium]|nr:diacylglycerol kinase family lipid kinase [Clostridia bacterium]